MTFYVSDFFCDYEQSYYRKVYISTHTSEYICRSVYKKHNYWVNVDVFLK